MVDPAEVEFVESERRKVRLHSVRGECIETYATLGQMLDMLPECFVQCHKSYLVNMACIVELRPTACCLFGQGSARQPAPAHVGARFVLPLRGP